MQWERPASPSKRVSYSVSPEPLAAALPAGWRKAFDPQGREYYHNSSTNKTQWERPTASAVNRISASQDAAIKARAAASYRSSLRSSPTVEKHARFSRGSSPEIGQSPLGAGWAIRPISPMRDARPVAFPGRPSMQKDSLYAAMTTQAVGRAVVTPSALPPGWKQANDPSGRTYYYNSRTQETRWERPAGQEARASRVSTGGGAAQVSTGGGAAMGARKSATKGVGFGLPPGWREARDPSGKLYYYNSHTKATQWEMPVAGEIPPERAGGR